MERSGVTMAKNLNLREGNITRLLFEFSLPAIIGMLVSGLYNIIARIFVGRGVGSLGIAATTVALPIMTLLMAVAILVSIGATALISLRMGEQKMKEAEKIAGNAAILLIIFPLAISIIYFLFSEPILRLFGASPEVMPYAKDYIYFIMIGAVPLGISYGMNNFIRAEGNPRVAMLTQIIAAVINIILNYIFIFKLNWGIKGSGLGTLIAQSISAIWVISYFFTGRSRIKIKFENLKPQLSIVLRIFSIGFAPFALQIANSIQQTILNNTLKLYGGDMALSAVGIVMSIAMFLLLPIVGISQGAQPLIGYNYGAQLHTRVTEIVKKGVLTATAMAIVGYAILHLFANQIVGLFSEGDVALTQLSVHAATTFLALMPIIGIQVVGSSYFQAVGKPIQSTILSLSRQVLIFIPLLLILPNFMGMEGVWRTAPIADIVSVLLTSTLLILELRKLHSTKMPIPAQAK